MKKFNLFLAAAAMIGMSASAQYTVTVTAPASIDVTAGDTFELPIDVANTMVTRDFQIWVNAPEGINAQTIFDEDIEEDIVYVDWNTRMNPKYYSFTAAYKKNTHLLLLLGYNANGKGYMKAGEGNFCTPHFVADIEAGEYDVVLQDIIFTFTNPDTSATESVKCDPVTVKVNVKDASGIENVVVAGEANDGAYYDLYGRRVANPVNGIYVHNGKKVLVK